MCDRFIAPTVPALAFDRALLDQWRNAQRRDCFANQGALTFFK